MPPNSSPPPARPWRRPCTSIGQGRAVAGGGFRAVAVADHQPDRLERGKGPARSLRRLSGGIGEQRRTPASLCQSAGDLAPPAPGRHRAAVWRPDRRLRPRARPSRPRDHPHKVEPGFRNAPRSASPDVDAHCVGGARDNLCPPACSLRDLPRVHHRAAARLASAPICVEVSPGRPTTTFAMRAASASRTAPAARARHPSTRRNGGAFLPGFGGRLAHHLADEQVKFGATGAASGPRMQAFRLSASIVKRVELPMIAGCAFPASAPWGLRGGAADPVKVTTSCPVTWSSRSPMLPHTSCSVPSGSSPVARMRRTNQFGQIRGLAGGLHDGRHPGQQVRCQLFQHSPDREIERV